MDNNRNSRWAEIRCDFCPNDDAFWRVDAWKTDDDNEEGKVIAYIDDLSGRVIYADPLARVDSYAQEVIQEQVADIQTRAHIEWNSHSRRFSMRIPTWLGDIVVTPDIIGDPEDEDHVYGTYIMLERYPDDPGKFTPLDLVGVEVKHDGVVLYTWEDVYTEDYQHKFHITPGDLEAIVVDTAEDGDSDA